VESVGGMKVEGMNRMQRRRSRLALSGRLALALCLTLGLSAGVAEAKKKKQKVGGKAVITKTVNGAIPDATGPPLNGGILNSTIKLGGKRFKKTRIRDVNVTVQTTGASGVDPAGDLIASLTAPNGATTYLFVVSLSGLSAGPLTLDDESSMLLGGGPPPAPFPFLAEPYAGTAQPQGMGFGSACLCVMDGGKATGKWVLRVFDVGIGETSVLNSWKLVVQAGKKYKS
jgi:subtilisin-like proprotein convertase family protein